jgi:zinc transport system permease protein
VWTSALDRLVLAVTDWAPTDSFLGQPSNVRGLLAVVLVSLLCGTVSSLVVGNRMAFFSDALAHCAFAGVALGLLISLASGATARREQWDFYKQWIIPLVMVGFGVLVGLLIAYVREKTGLASDTVIGVFFAGAIGLGAMFLKALSHRVYFNPENFLFGDPITVTAEDLVVLACLTVLTVVFLYFMYNRLVFTSFNPSLARSRRIPVRWCNYAFIVLLALIVNLSLKAVGALLINALLIVPAATAANLCRNMRQLFWVTTLLCLFVGITGQWLSWEIPLPDPSGKGDPTYFGSGGTIVVLSVLLFYLSMALGPRLRGRKAG